MKIIGALLLTFGFINMAWAAPRSNLDPFWARSDENSTIQIDHRLWQEFLDTYLVEVKDVTLLRYQKVTALDQNKLKNYIHLLTTIDPRVLNSLEQKSYWVNLYNALTVNIVLENYPVESILEVYDSWFSFGPWNEKITVILNQELSLNDIEHRIIRPIYQDNRVHYVLNCASMGCPNLSKKVFTHNNINEQLEVAAKKFINHTRAIDVKNDEIILSSIYVWYQSDFGDSTQGLFKHIAKYIEYELPNNLDSRNLIYQYDWALNEINQ